MSNARLVWLQDDDFDITLDADEDFGEPGGSAAVRIASRTVGDTAEVFPRVVGPGIALAATAGGGYIVALAPRPKIAQGESPVQAVVYRVNW